MRDYQDFFMKKLPAMRANSKGLSAPFIRFSHGLMRKDQKGPGFILGGLLHPVAASLVLLVSTRPTLALCARMARIQRGQDGH